MASPAVPAEPRIDSDLRLDFSPEQIEMVRRGLWKVVNEDGGTGGRARLKGVEVAGKTGTAQASTNGKKDTIAWFCCFAPSITQNTLSWQWFRAASMADRSLVRSRLAFSIAPWRWMRELSSRRWRGWRRPIIRIRLPW